ncbi:MAG: N-acetyltransferase [Burkholderiales bacterium]|nr:N-acetyltransferase [Burkholderiales bacterium]
MISVEHDADNTRFMASVQGRRCVADYDIVDGVMWMTHTLVPPAVEGRGIAAELVRVALEYARANGLRVHPACSYVRAYMQRHPETQDLLES